MNNIENKSDEYLSSVKDEEIIDVIIVGCGIGGLVSALCLNRCGIKIRL